MALVKRVVDLPFTQGVDTKTNPKLQVRPSRMENVVYRGGTPQKRYGTTQLTANIDTGGTFSAGESLFAYNNELVRLQGGKAYGLSQQFGKWVTKAGGGHFATHTATRVVDNMRSQVSPDACLNSTYGLVGVSWWEDATGGQEGVHFAVYDGGASGNLILQPTLISATNPTGGQSLHPRVVPVDGSILIFWHDDPAAGLNIEGAVYSGTTPQTAPSGFVAAGDWFNTGAESFEAVYYNHTAILVYPRNTAGTHFLSAVSFNSSGVVSQAAVNILTQDVNTILSAVVDATNNRLYVLFSDNGGTFYVCVNATTFATILGKTSVSGTQYGQGGGALSGTSVVWVVGNSNSSQLATATVNQAGVVSGLSNIPGTAYLTMVSDVFTYDSAICFAVTSGNRGSGAQNTYPTHFVIDTSGNAIAKILPGLAANTQPTTGPNSRLGRAFADPSTGATTLHLLQRNRFTVQGTNGTAIDVTTSGITKVALLATKANVLPVNRLGDSVYIGGSLPRLYDGTELVESSFSFFPEGLSVSAGGGVGNLLPGAVYQYSAVYSWTSATGELMRSAPAPAVSFTATNSGEAVVSIPCLELSGFDLNGLAGVNIEIYRTQGNGTLFYRVNGPSSLKLNSTSAATVSYTDDLSDASLAVQEPLYTTGGVMPGLTCPAHSLACVHKGRLAIAGLEDPYSWQTSAVTVQGTTLRFNPAWGGRLPSSTGKITGLASMDDKLFIFVERGCYVVTGDGPDALGNNNWPTPFLLSSVDAGPLTNAVGAPTPVVVAPQGILYTTNQGVMLLDRSLNASYFGADVESYASVQANTLNTVRAIVVRPELQQVWLTTDEGTDTNANAVTLVYDYFYNAWSYFPSYGGQWATYWKGTYVRVRSDGVVWQEQTGTFKDFGSTYSGLVETQWIKPAELAQGYGRVWYASVLGTYYTDFTLTLQVAYDYAGTSPTSPTYTDTVTLVGNGVYSTGGPFQVRHYLGHKCESVKFLLSDSAIGGSGQGMGLAVLSLELGVKKGSFKLPSAKTL